VSASNSAVQVRPFRRADRHQLTSLVNRHLQAVVPGTAVSVNTVLSQLEGEPDEFIVDPWVGERRTLVAEQRGRISAAAYLQLYRDAADVNRYLRGTGAIRWLLCWPDAPFWPDARAAGEAVVRTAVDWFRGSGVRRIDADGALPAPGSYGIPDCWPHIQHLLAAAGFSRADRYETVYLADVGGLPRIDAPLPTVACTRSLGVNGTRLTARLDGTAIGYIEVESVSTDAGRTGQNAGWADIGNLEVDERFRRKGLGRWLLGEAADWLRLGHVDRLIAYAEHTHIEEQAFYSAAGFVELTRTGRDWHRNLGQSTV